MSKSFFETYAMAHIDCINAELDQRYLFVDHSVLSNQLNGILASLPMEVSGAVFITYP